MIFLQDKIAALTLAEKARAISFLRLKILG